MPEVGAQEEVVDHGREHQQADDRAVFRRPEDGLPSSEQAQREDDGRHDNYRPEGVVGDNLQSIAGERAGEVEGRQA